MAIDAYAEVQDLFRHGMPAALAVPEQRSLEAVDAAANVFMLQGHGLEADWPLQFVSVGGAVSFGFTTLHASETLLALGHGRLNGQKLRLGTTGALPTGLAPATDYYVRDALADSFKLAATPGGAVVPFSDDGTGVHVAATNPLPSPLSPSAVYYAKPVLDSDSLFQVAATPGGAAVDLGDVGGPGVLAVRISVRPKLEAALVARARHIDNHIPGNAVPLTTWTANERRWNAVLAAADLTRALGRGNPMHADALASLDRAAELVQARLDVHATGSVPLRSGAVDPTPAELEGAAEAWGEEPERGWHSKCGGLLL